jgi:enoyl-CoA hydratase
MVPEFTNVLVDVQGAVATVTINRPDKLNILSTETLQELRQAIEAVIEKEEIRAAIITGAGDRAFAAGADVSELARLSASQAKKYAEFGQSLFNTIEKAGKPFVAAINGYAFGGGCELALACSIRIASEKAKLGQPEIKLGIMTGFGGSQRLVRLVGKARAMQLCLLGEPIEASDALEWGLVAGVVPAESLMPEANLLAQKLASYPPIMLKYTLEAINTASDLPLNEGQAYEANLFALCFSTEDMKEGTAAFLEKRRAKFKGK